MTTPNATVAPPQSSAARRFTEQIHALTDRQTREYVLGLAVLTAEACGYSRPKEGEQVRDLLDEIIAKHYYADPKGYEKAVRAGRREMAKRDEATERRRSDTSAMVARANA